MKKVKNIFVSILVLLVAVLSFGTVLITHSHESVVNAGSGIYVENSGEFNATGGVIKDNAKGAITINGGTHTIENVVFDGNLETAINVRGGVLNLVNCRITNNLSSSNGGAINVASGATLNLKGTTTITGNSAINGGAIYAAAGSTVNISGKLNIKNNTATSYGGAIFSAGAVNIAADFTGSIKGNTANIGADGYMNAGTLDVNSNASGFYFVTMAGTATTTSPAIIPFVDSVGSTTTYATNTLDYNYINSALTGVATEENSCGWFRDLDYKEGVVETYPVTKINYQTPLYTKTATLDKLTFTVANGEATVKAKNTSITGNVVIPRKYNGARVTSVESNAFKELGITDVTLSNSITNVKENAFYSCRSLSKINFPQSVTVIKNSAFYYCTALTELDIGNGVKTIESNAFKQCSSLTSIKMPGSVTTIQSDAFATCISLTEVNVTDLAAWCKIDFAGWLSNPLAYAKKLYLKGTQVTELNIPNGITEIKKYNFVNGSSFTSITIPNGVTIIGEDAFSGCSSITSVTIPSSVVRINYGAFNLCSSLTRVNITDVAAWCNINFYNQLSNPLQYAKNLYLNGSELINLVIPANVKTIKNYAFYNCLSLASATIPSSVTSIEQKAFFGCDVLYFVKNSSNLSIVAGNTDNGYVATNAYKVYGPNETLGTLVTSNGFTYLVDESEAMLIKYTGSLTTIEIPSTFNGKNVTTICDNAFNNKTSITSVTIPSSVTNIGKDAFNKCSKLSQVNITDIAAWCNISFDNSYSNPLVYARNLYLNGSKITDLVIPSGITEIKKHAFYNGSFVSVTIPSSVASISNYAFYGCSSLTRVDIADLTAWCNIDFDYGSNPLVYARNLYLNGSKITDLVIPSDVTKIKGRAFYGGSFVSVTIPNSVTSIGYSSFENCSYLRSITMPIIGSSFSDIFGSKGTIVTLTSGTSLPANYFRNSTTITRITFTGNDLISIGNAAFLDCSALTYVELPKSVKTIGTSVFARTKISEITIPESCTSIGRDAFASCSSLQKVNLACKITNIQKGMFYECANLTSVSLPTTVLTIESDTFTNCSKLKTVTLPSGLTSIGNNAFRGCSLLNNVTIPSTVKSIGISAFYNCSSLTSIEIPSGVTKLEDDTLNGCTSLVSLVIPSTVTSIGNNTFTKCTGLKNITTPVFSTYFQGTFGSNATTIVLNGGGSVPNSYLKHYSKLETLSVIGNITEIGSAAFTECDSLTSINLSGNVKVIGSRAFGRLNITSITIPSSVTSIGDEAFSGCTLLSYIKIPSSVKTIGTFAFYGCSALGSVTIADGVETIGKGTFSQCTALESIIIPSSVTTMGDSVFDRSGISRITFRSGTGTLTLGIEMFFNCERLSTVNLGDRINTLPRSTFYGCIGLTSFEIPNTVTNLGVKLFRKCSNLTTVTFASGSLVTIIPAQMFSECTKLTSVSFPSTITKFDVMEDSGATAAETFENCTSLKSVTLPENITYIGNKAFVGCTALTSATFANPAGTWSANGTSFTVTTASTNATRLRTTYVNYIWTKNTANVSNFTYVLSSNGNTYSVKDNGCSGAVVVPATYNGKPVTQIAENGFKNNTNITSMTLPDSVKQIGKGAFSGCTNLTRLTMNSAARWLAYNLSTMTKTFISVEDPVSAASSVKTYSDRVIEYWPNENLAPF